MELLKKFIESELKLDSSGIMEQFILYEKLLMEWNKKVNLVSRKTVSIEEHIINSIFFLSKYDFKNVQNFADIGTGGGFPGIPLKILFPDTEAILIDSVRKKMNALDDILLNINMNKVKVVCARAEEISVQKEYKSKFDVVLSKAVAPLENLFIWGKNFLNKKGELLCIKGGNIDEELQQLKKMKYKFDVKVIKFAFDSSYNIEDKKLVILKNIF